MADEESTAAIERTWWTDDRVSLWERLDDATQTAKRSYDPDRYLIGGFTLHASAPNPGGINANISPDEWHVTLPDKEGRVDAETIASILADELEATITLCPRTDEWEPGVWLIVNNAEQVLLDGGEDRGGGQND